jgi:type I restriction enzyme, S subunit
MIPPRYKPYPAYKDSGIEWLGRIPKHWEVKRLKFAAELNPSPLEIRRLPRNAEISFVPMEAVGEYGGLDLTRTKAIANVDSGLTYFRDGDVIVAKITPCFENGKGALAGGLTGGAAFGTTELHVLRALDAFADPQYLFYITLANAFRRLGEAEMYGAGGQKRVPETFVKNLKQPLPPKEEQRAIAAFLDQQMARINELKARKERLVELLEEKRTALIAHATTKGIDPRVPMKDSGVAWLGVMPAHWELVPSTWLFRESKQRALEGDQQLSATQKYGVISQAEFERVEGRQVVHALLHLDQRKHVEIDDFVMSMRSFEGGLERVRVRGCVRSSYVALRASRDVYVGYYSYLFKSSAYIQALRATSNFIRDGQDLNFENFRLVRLPLVPIMEQEGIAAFLDRETAKIDTLISKVRNAIETLKELRTGLISAAVTGKIDVRGKAS